MIMNKDQIDGKLQDIGGKIQEEAGKLVGNPDQQVKGLKNQVEGKAQEKLGDLKDRSTTRPNKQMKTAATFWVRGCLCFM
jgi:uncharacterized protein YjbJ (UPF0337 family)